MRMPKHLRFIFGRACIRFLIYAGSFIFIFISTAYAKTIYMGPSESYKTLRSAFSAMSGGDTLIIRNGTYTGDSNQIRYNLKPPSGSTSSYTQVKAEEPRRG